MDCATIMYSPDNIKKLFLECNKIKGQQYQKHFRLDGVIPVNEMFHLASSFFPFTELVEEVILSATAVKTEYLPVDCMISFKAEVFGVGLMSTKCWLVMTCMRLLIEA